MLKDLKEFFLSLYQYALDAYAKMEERKRKKISVLAQAGEAHGLLMAYPQYQMTYIISNGDCNCPHCGGDLHAVTPGIVLHFGESGCGKEFIAVRQPRPAE